MEGRRRRLRCLCWTYHRRSLNASKQYQKHVITFTLALHLVLCCRWCQLFVVCVRYVLNYYTRSRAITCMTNIIVCDSRHWLTHRNQPNWISSTCPPYWWRRHHFRANEFSSYRSVNPAGKRQFYSSISCCDCVWHFCSSSYWQLPNGRLNKGKLLLLNLFNSSYLWKPEFADSCMQNFSRIWRRRGEHVNQNCPIFDWTKSAISKHGSVFVRILRWKYIISSCKSNN